MKNLLILSLILINIGCTNNYRVKKAREFRQTMLIHGNNSVLYKEDLFSGLDKGDFNKVDEITKDKLDYQAELNVTDPEAVSRHRSHNYSGDSSSDVVRAIENLKR